MKTIIRNLFVVAVILYVHPWCRLALGDLWAPVFNHFLERPFELKILILEMPSVFLFSIWGLLASMLLRSEKKRAWLIAMALVACISEVVRTSMGSDSSMYHRVFLNIVVALPPWFILVGILVHKDKKIPNQSIEAIVTTPVD